MAAAPPRPPTARGPSRRAVLAALPGLALAAAGGPAFPPAVAQERAHRIYVTNIGWHTGIAVRREAVAARDRIPEIGDFPDAAYVEFGWGDRNYYTDPDPSAFQALGAGFAPGPAVLHLIGMRGPPHRFYGSAEVLAVPVSDATLGRLIAQIDGTFDRPPEGRAEPIRSALVRGAYFYPAHGRFHLFNTCNTWVARMLAEAGLDVSYGGVVTAGDLMGQVRELPGVRPAEDQAGRR
jgi:uncharacterized protein (TIGR02117 family)